MTRFTMIDCSLCQWNFVRDNPPASVCLLDADIPLIEPAFLAPEPAGCVTRSSWHQAVGKQANYEREDSLGIVSHMEVSLYSVRTLSRGG